MAERIVTVQYRTDNPYTIAEVEMVKSAILETVLELDEEADKSSLTIAAMTEVDAVEAKKKEILDFLENADISATVSITQGSLEISATLVEGEG